MTQIVAGRFAEILGAAGEIEHVVDDLKRHADVRAEGAERLDVLCGRVAEDGAHLGGAGEERRGLAEDARFVLLARLVQAMGVEHLAQLTVADVAERRGEDGDDADAPGGGGQHRGLGEEVVADQDDGAGAQAPS